MSQQQIVIPRNGVLRISRLVFVAIVMITITWSLTINKPPQLQPKVFISEISDSWVNVGPGMFVFSAYLDVRKHLYYSKRGVVALAVQSIDVHEPNLYCLLTDDSGNLVCAETPINTVLIKPASGEYKYHQYFYICNISSSAITPTFVSFSSKMCLEPSPRIPVIQIHNESNSSKKFGVCIHSPLFHVHDAQFIIQTIEMNRILGAQWFTFYIHNAGQDVRRVLEEYSKVGVVDVVRSTLPNISVRYYGQQLLMHDCGYRNMYKVRYLLYTDLDEIVVPQNSQNWAQVMTQIDRKSIGAFQFRHVALVGETTSKTLAVCNSSKKIEMPRFMKFTDQTILFPFSKRSKFLIKPETFARMEIHKPRNLLKGFFTYQVPSEIALLYHYRLPSLHIPKNKIKDNQMNRYLPELTARIKDWNCKIDLEVT